MKAVQIIKPNQLEVIDVEKPVIDSKNNVLVKMTAAGICGSDVGIYHGTNAAATYPRIIGHEMVGVVAETGDTVSSLKKETVLSSTRLQAVVTAIHAPKTVAMCVTALKYEVYILTVDTANILLFLNRIVIFFQIHFLIRMP